MRVITDRPYHALFAKTMFIDPTADELEAFEPEARKHPGLSGFDFIASGPTAFEARYVFARLAERTIDAQYFIWSDDATGRNLLLALIASTVVARAISGGKAGAGGRLSHSNPSR